MSDCLFCKMVAGDIQPDVVFEDNEVLAFRDLNPQAPLHVLVIPKTHIATTNDLTLDTADVVGKMYLAARQIAADEGVAEPGYRMVMNCNAGAGQSVYHIHLHLLGGRPLGWPPG
ncbi:MAG: histidine triad nucleotide-binding protein [Gammaproteobacteria bacterium]